MMEVDMMLLALICFVFVLLVLSILIFLWYLGLFLNIDVKTCKPPFADLEVAYKYVKGSYRDCGLLFSEAHSAAPELRCIGVYYDDPHQVDDNSLRYIVGLIITDTKDKTKEELRKDVLSKGFQVAKFPEVEHVVYSAFPHRSSLSVLIAVNRVIPVLQTYIKDRELQAYPLIEIYGDEEILYAAPLSKQEEFFVPEALVESEEEATSDQRNEEGEDSLRELEEIPDTISSADSLVEIASKVEELPASGQVLETLDDERKNGVSNGSEASTESFEELQLDS